MIVIVLKKFKDKKENVIRNVGDKFKVTKSRFAELQKFSGYVKEFVEENEVTEESPEEKVEENK